MDTDQPAVVSGSTHTLRTRVDGSLSITIEIEPAHAQAAFALFGAPGTPVALARLTQEAAQADMQAETVKQAEEDWGHVYEDLFRLGWFNNPRVAAAFNVSMTKAPQARITHIKQLIYDEFDITSLKELEPQYFVASCDQMGIRDTIPASILEAAAGRAI